MDGYVTIGTSLDTSKIDKQIGLLEDKLEGLEEEYQILEKAEPFEAQQDQLIKMGNEIDRTKKKVASLRKEKDKINNQGFINLNNSINGVGNSLNSVIKKVVKWGLAVFGVRSAYMFVRQAMSTLSQYDDGMKANIDYIRFALATAIKPIIEWIINAVYKMLAYINYIAQAWFGINLFANASVKAFNKANKGAKKLQKTMASFDEMNVLSDKQSDSTGTPSFDLSKLDKIQIPDWVKWIAENKDVIFKVAEVIAGLFGASVIAGWIKNLGTFMGAKGLGLLGKTLGSLALIASGIAIIGLVAKKVWDDAGKLKKELKEIRELNTEAQKEWVKNEEDINALINTGNVNRTAGYEILKKTGGVWNWINGLGYENLNQAKQVAINIQNQLNKSVELYKQGKLNNEEQEKLKQNIIEQVKYNSDLIQKLKEEGWNTQEIENLNKKLIQDYKDMGGNVEEVNTELSNINKIKFDDKEIEIKVYGDTTSFKEAMRRAIEYGQNLIGGLGFSAGGGGADGFGGKTSGQQHSSWRAAKGGIFYPSKLPKLAVGGIINRPGPGVAYNGAYIGERGAEAVVPLTDSQQMELLGSTIGRYVNIQLTSNLDIDGRLFARKVEQINNSNNFVLNR